LKSENVDESTTIERIEKGENIERLENHSQNCFSKIGSRTHEAAL
jgi:hypothetical protein